MNADPDVLSDVEMDAYVTWRHALEARLSASAAAGRPPDTADVRALEHVLEILSRQTPHRVAAAEVRILEAMARLSRLRDGGTALPAPPRRCPRENNGAKDA